MFPSCRLYRTPVPMKTLPTGSPRDALEGNTLGERQERRAGKLAVDLDCADAHAVSSGVYSEYDQLLTTKGLSTQGTKGVLKIMHDMGA